MGGMQRVLFLFALGGAVFAQQPPVSKPAPKTARSPAADARAITRADLQFEHEAQTRGADAWFDFAAPGVYLPQSDVKGKAAVKAVYTKAYAQTGFKLTWHPDYAHVAGDIGVTSGRYELHMPGRPERTGRYLTVWTRQPDGAWKFSWDSGTPDQQ